MELVNNIKFAQKTQPVQYKYAVFLIMLFLTASLTSAVLAHRMVLIGDFLEPGGIFIYPITYFLGDVIAEVYGYKLARQIIWSVIICEFIFAITIYVVIHLPAPEFWNLKEEYIGVLEHILRLSIVGALGTLCGEFVNIYLITKTGRYLQGKHFWLRSILSSSFGEAVVTLITFTFSFITIIPDSYVICLIVNGYFFKLIYGMVLVWPAMYLVSFLKKNENIDFK